MKPIFALLLLLPTLTLAQTPSTSVIPYSGTLFSQGKPVSQDTDVLMAFALYSGDAMTALPAGSTNEAPDAALADESPNYNRLWTSWTTEDGAASQLSSLTSDNPDTVGVKVRNGRFLVHLGASGQTALPDSVFDQRPLYVVTWVVNASGVFRLPPQALDKVPHAVTAERATNFTVTQNLTVVGNTSLQGRVFLEPSEVWPQHGATLQINNHHGRDPTFFGLTDSGESKNFLRGHETVISGQARVSGDLTVYGGINVAAAMNVSSNKTIQFRNGRKGWEMIATDEEEQGVPVGGNETTIAECPENYILWTGRCRASHVNVRFYDFGPVILPQPNYDDTGNVDTPVAWKCAAKNLVNNPQNIWATAICLRVE